MEENLKNIRESIDKEIIDIKTIQQLNELKSKYLGKEGSVTELSKSMKDVPNELKKEVGIKINEVRNYVTELITNKENEIKENILNEKLNSEVIDITLPSKKIKRGSLHPMTRITEEFEDLFVSMGYTVYGGPEVESDENCFQKLNLPKGHPARDAQDTFYLENEVENYLLRSQTSTAQVHAMEENQEKGPIRIVCPGKVYRRDEDATHSHQFMQLEGLVVDKNITLSDLK